jgi:hypothetical protein
MHFKLFSSVNCLSTHLEHSDIWESHGWCHVQYSGNSVHRNPLFSPISVSRWAMLASLMAVHRRPERCSSTTVVRLSWNISTHWNTFLFYSYSFHNIAESFFCESHLVSPPLTTEILLQNAAPLWCNFLAGQPWFSHCRLNCARPAIRCMLPEPSP